MRFNKFIKNYATITQGLFSIVVYALLGYFIGYAIDKDSFWPVLLLVVGIILGLITFIVYLLKLLKDEAKERKNNGSKSED